MLVSSTDGVGTKSKIAAALGRYGGLGEDVVNACVNDVVVCGATPAYFLDYIGVGELDAAVVEELLSGMVRACETAGCALIGGETAQMPGVYAAGDFDLVGFAVGVVERDEILDPADVEIGDVLVGLPSSGLHTNGYSLVRRVFGLDDDPSPLHRYRPELGRTLGEELLEPHRSYVSTVQSVRAEVKSIAHVTGGGLIENLPARPAGRHGGLSGPEVMGRPSDIRPDTGRRRDIRRRDVQRVQHGPRHGARLRRRQGDGPGGRAPGRGSRRRSGCRNGPAPSEGVTARL